MINYIKGNLLSQRDGMIVHGTNCSGGFGSGVAGAIRYSYPEVYAEFAKLKPDVSLLGTIQPVQINEQLTITNCFTQHKFGSDGKAYASKTAIASSLLQAYAHAEHNDINTVSMPKIGAGLGGLSWENDVLPVVESIAELFPNIVTNVYYID